MPTTTTTTLRGSSHSNHASLRRVASSEAKQSLKQVYTYFEQNGMGDTALESIVKLAKEFKVLEARNNARKTQEVFLQSFFKNSV